MFMRKIAVFLMSVLMTLTICGCSSEGGNNSMKKDLSVPSEISQAYTGPYNTTANIKYKDITAQAVFTKDDGGTVTVTFLSPDSLKDIKFVYTEQLVTVSYKEMEFSLDPNSFLASSVTKTIISSIDMVTKQNGVRVQLQDEGLMISGEMQTGTFQLVLDKKSGNALKLQIPQDDLEVEFVNFSFVK